MHAHSGRNYAKTALLLGLLTGLAVGVGYAIGGTSWAIGGFAIAVVMNFVSYWWSDRIVLALHRAQPVSEAEQPALHRIVARLAQRAGIPKPRLFYVPDPSPNAFATGRDPDHAVVCVTEGILQLCNERELEGVLAHELSHVTNRDILISSVAATMAGAVALIGRVFFYGEMFGGSNDRERGGAVAALLISVLAGVIATLTQLAISRSREYAADASGARLVGDPEALASALRKLAVASQRIPMASASPATAHLYIVAPLAGGGGMTTLLMTHPPLEKRIERLENMKRETGYGSAR